LKKKAAKDKNIEERSERESDDELEEWSCDSCPRPAPWTGHQGGEGAIGLRVGEVARYVGAIRKAINTLAMDLKSNTSKYMKVQPYHKKTAKSEPWRQPQSEAKPH